MKSSLSILIAVVSLFCLISCKKNNDANPLADESANYTVSTLAGGEDGGYVNATGTSARFYYPGGIVTDAGNNVYVADRNNHRLRKISPSNVVTTFAGSGIIGGADGNSTTAQFDFPTFLTKDAQGNLFVVDSLRARIRKITPNGEVTTYYPNPMQTDTSRLGMGQFGSIDGLAIDNSGNFFIADGVNKRIRKISSSGIVSTLAGSGVFGYADGTGTAAQFTIALSHIVLDAQGNLYVNDNSRIRKISPSGQVSTLITIGDPNASLIFVSADGLAVDAQGTVYIGVNQSFNGTYLAKINSAGNLAKIAGVNAGYADGLGSSAKFELISFLTIDQNGDIIVTDGEKIRKVKKN
jgi:sugar lactone lactonase YvrE